MAITLFLTLNWLGSHSISAGYVTLTSFQQTDGAPAFNLLYRILGPIVFIIIASSFLYLLELDKFVVNIWMVVLYYYIGRIIFVSVFGRFSLMNWGREGFLLLTSVLLSWILYNYIIQDSSTLLPEAKDLKNQFWILIIIFIYTSFNGMQFSSKGTKKRKDAYLTKLYYGNKLKYGQLVSILTVDALSESLIYSVLMYEQFNRPAFVQRIERLVFPWGSKSLGPMQVKTTVKISDNESVRLGALQIMNSYNNAIEEGKLKAIEKDAIFEPLTNSSHRQYVIYKVASNYNRDDEYLNGVDEMHSQVIDHFYPDLKFKYAHWSEGLI